MRAVLVGFLAVVGLCGLAVAGGHPAPAVQTSMGDVVDNTLGPPSDWAPAPHERGRVQQTGGTGDWPTFAHDAANTGYNPVAAGPSEPVTVAWNTTIEGRSMSPVVVGDRAYVATGAGLFAVDRSNGSVLFHAEGGYVGQPAVADGTLYVVGGDTLYAVSTTDGSQQWTLQINGRIGQPTVVDGTVYVHTPDTAFAVDAATGSIRWQTPMPGDCAEGFCFASSLQPPAVVNGTVYVSMGNLLALDADSGAIRWNVSRAPGRQQPVVVDGTVYRATVTGNVSAFDAETGQRLWERNLTSAEITSSPAVVNRTIYVAPNSPHLYALDATDGSVRWQVETNRPLASSPAVASGTVYVDAATDDESGRRTVLYAVAAASGTIQWAAPFERPPRAGPLVVAESVYTLRGTNDRARLSRVTGEQDAGTEPLANRSGAVTPVPVRTATPAGTATPTPPTTSASGTEPATRGDSAPTASPSEREPTVSPSPTLTRPPNDGLGRGLALAAILFLSGIGLIAGSTGGLALGYGWFRSDQFDRWELVLFGLVAVGGLFAAVRGFTFDASGGDTYSLAVLTSLGSAGLLVVWLLVRGGRWLLRRGRGTTGDEPSEGLGGGVVVGGLVVVVVLGIISLMVSVVAVVALLVLVGVPAAYYLLRD